ESQRIERRRWHTATVDAAVDGAGVCSDLFVVCQIKPPHQLAGKLVEDGRNVFAEGNRHSRSPFNSYFSRKGAQAQSAAALLRSSLAPWRLCARNSCQTVDPEHTAISAEDQRAGDDVLLPDRGAETVTVPTVVTIGLHSEIVPPEQLAVAHVKRVDR